MMLDELLTNQIVLRYLIMFLSTLLAVRSMISPCDTNSAIIVGLVVVSVYAGLDTYISSSSPLSSSINSTSL